MEIEAEVTRELPVIDFADLPPFIVVSSEPEPISPSRKSTIVLFFVIGKKPQLRSRFGESQGNLPVRSEKMIGSSMVTSRAAFERARDRA